MSQKESLVRLGGGGVSRCGYCENYGFTSHGKVKYGCMAETLTVQDYQDMIDRGWRRSGKYIYKPKIDETCCPQYTIRLRAEDFVANKEQEKVVRKMQKYLNGVQKDQKNGNQMEIVEQDKIIDSEVLEQSIKDAAKQLIKDCILSQECRFDDLTITKIKKGKGKTKGGDVKKGIFSCPVGFKLHRFLIQKDGEQIPSSAQDRTRLIADAMQQIISPQLQNGWNVVSQNGHLNFDNQVVRQQMNQQNNSCCPKQCKGEKQETNMEVPAHQLEVVEVPSQFIEEEYQLYKKYQMSQHGDEEGDVSRYQYRRFLVDSPLVSEGEIGGEGAPKSGYGSFHHQYRIDGKLVAVGVVDVLPRCLSSVYFFWDPDYAHLSLGKYSAVNEINWVKDVSKTCPQLQYYYLGFYIQSCHKMRYKGDYQPSQLLCPLNFTWVNLTDEVTKALTEDGYCVLSELQNSEDEVIENGNHSQGNCQFCLEQRALTEIVPEETVEETQLSVRGIGQISCSQLMQMGVLRSPKRLLEAIQEWHTLAGPAAERIILSI